MFDMQLIDPLANLPVSDREICPVGRIGDQLLLPLLRLLPRRSGDYYAKITEVSFLVDGVLKDEIRRAYPKVVFDDRNNVLHEPRDFPPERFTPSVDIRGEEIVLRVVVKYQRVHRMMSNGKDDELPRSWKLRLPEYTRPRDEPPLAIPVDPPRPPEPAEPGRPPTSRSRPTTSARKLSFSWVRQTLEVGFAPAELDVQGEANLTEPRLTLEPATGGGAELAQRLIKISGPQATTGLDGQPCHRFTLSLSAGGEERRRLIAATQHADLPLSLVVTGVRGSTRLEGESALFVNCVENQAAGALAIDLGYRATSAAVWDQQLKEYPPIASPEQTATLRLGLERLLETDPDAAVPAGQRVHWETWLSASASALFNEHKQLASRHREDEPARQLKAALKTIGPYPVLRHLELSLYHEVSLSSEFLLAATLKLQALYEPAINEFPLWARKLVVVSLDPENMNAQEVPSDLLVTDLGPPLKADIGVGAEIARDKVASKDWSEARLRFFPSAKARYQDLGSDTPAQIEVATPTAEKDAPRKATVPSTELIRAAYRRVLELADVFRQRGRGDEKLGGLAKGRFRRVIFTFPTTAPLAVRVGLQRMAARDLRIPQPLVVHDEATSRVLFFLAEQFRGDLEFGPEAALTYCRPIRQPGRTRPAFWEQNILLVDVGGGTTDLNLLQILIKEEDPYAGMARPERRAGGRYYTVIPRLLGVNGREQLGGEYLTLLVYTRLKAKLADALAIHAQKRKDELARSGVGDSGTGTALTTALDALDMSLFRDREGRYIPGSIPEFVDLKQMYDSPGCKAAEQFLPTAWYIPEGDDLSGVATFRERHDRRNVFLELWKVAEKAKRFLAIEPESGQSPEKVVFKMDRDDLDRVLRACEIDLPGGASERLGTPVTLTALEMQIDMNSVLDEVAALCRGLAEKKLPGESPILDRVIFSGNGCRQPQLRERVREELAKSTAITWNRERWQFNPKHAKSGTVLGACFAQSCADALPPDRAMGTLELGLNCVRFKLGNLLSTLPFGFMLVDNLNREHDLFDAGETLDFDEMEGTLRKRRVNMEAFAAGTIKRKKVTDDDDSQPWGKIDCQPIRVGLGLKADEFAREYRLHFEITQDLRMTYLISHGEPHYLLADDRRMISVVQRLRELLGDGHTSDENLQGLWERLAGWKLGVGPANAVVEEVLSLGTFPMRFHAPGEADPKGRGGARSVQLPHPVNEMYSFRVSRPNSAGVWEHLCDLPALPSLAQQLKDYENLDNIEVLALLDDQGELRLHRGLMSYWLTEQVEDLKQPGRVYLGELGPDPQVFKNTRDPNCGRH